MDILDAVEVRVLGSLVEKELSTPDYYPMTVNALTAACNQKSNRDPVVSFTEEDVLRGVEGLQRKRLVGTSTYGRATKYRHTLGERFDLDRPRLAVLASLMLRGPETAGEVGAVTPGSVVVSAAAKRRLAQSKNPSATTSRVTTTAVRSVTDFSPRSSRSSASRSHEAFDPT